MQMAKCKECWQAGLKLVVKKLDGFLEQCYQPYLLWKWCFCDHVCLPFLIALDPWLRSFESSSWIKVSEVVSVDGTRGGGERVSDPLWWVAPFRVRTQHELSPLKLKSSEGEKGPCYLLKYHKFGVCSFKYQRETNTRMNLYQKAVISSGAHRTCSSFWVLPHSSPDAPCK